MHAAVIRCVWPSFGVYGRHHGVTCRLERLRCIWPSLVHMAVSVVHAAVMMICGAFGRHWCIWPSLVHLDVINDYFFKFAMIAYVVYFV